jgi:hypothetical protein
MAVEKIGKQLSLTASRGEEKHTWTAKEHDEVIEGRMGLRQMRGRESRYENFNILTRPASK